MTIRLLMEKKEKVNILSIETSCDETALSFVTASGGLENPQFEVRGDVVASQIALHRPYGGVVPALAKRAHLDNLPILFKRLVDDGMDPHQLDLIAVTVGPGLEPA